MHRDRDSHFNQLTLAIRYQQCYLAGRANNSRCVGTKGECRKDMVDDMIVKAHVVEDDVIDFMVELED